MAGVVDNRVNLNINYDKLKILELKEVCKNRGIQFKSNWRKHMYIEALKNQNIENISLNSQGLVSGLEKTVLVAEESSKLKAITNVEKKRIPVVKAISKVCIRELTFEASSSAHSEFVLDKKILNSLPFYRTPRMLPNSDEIAPPAWLSDLSILPELNINDVYDYFIRATVTVDNIQRNDTKSIKRAIAHHKAGDIHSKILVAQVTNSLFYIKSQCYASERSLDYRVAVCLKTTGKVCAGACECTIGKSGSCSHIGTLLLCIVSYCQERIKSGDAACTSKPCVWNKPRGKTITPSILKPNLFKKPKLLQEIDNSNPEDHKQFDFDPRLNHHRVVNSVSVVKAVAELAEIFPETGIKHFWDIKIEHQVPEVEIEVEINTTDGQDIQKDLKHIVEAKPSTPINGPNVSPKLVTSTIIKPNNETDPNENHKIVNTHKYLNEAQKLILKLRGESLPVSDEDSLVYVMNQKVNLDLINYIERETISQSQSRFWFDLRQGRITSSIFGLVYKARCKTIPKSIIEKILNPNQLSKYSNLPKAMQRGIDLEPVALERYKDLTGFTVEKSGLSIHSEYSFLGASGHGIITDPNVPSKGVLEIKCPSSVKNQDISLMPATEIASKFKEFCISKVGDEYKLKLNSPYYLQIMGEMAIKKLTWADFVIFTGTKETSWVYIERIQFDPELWKGIEDRLISFYRQYIVPYVIENGS